MQEQYIWIDDYGHKFYYKDREMTIYHRLDGPAVEWSNGYKEWSNEYKEWYVDGKKLTEKEFNALSAPTLELTLEDIAAKYGVDASKVKIKA
jgi:ribosomal protein L20A (L18A)